MNERSEKSRFGDLLLEMRLVEEGVLAAALAERRKTGKRLVRILADKRVIDEDRLTKAVAAKLNLETVALDAVRIHRQVLGRLPAAVAQKHGMLPYAVKRTARAEVLFLVMSDPLDVTALTEAQRHSGCQVRVMLATPSALDAAIEAHYGRLESDKVSESEGVPKTNEAPDVSGFQREGTLVDKPATSAEDLHLDITLPGLAPELPPFDPSITPVMALEGDSPPTERTPIPPRKKLSERPVLDAVWDDPDATPRVLSLALEVPMDYEEDRNHPFRSMEPFDLPVGLDETGIIPEVTGRERFDPPPPETFPSDPTARRGLRAGDIPINDFEVAARGRAEVDEEGDSLDVIQVETVEEDMAMVIEAEEVRSLASTVTANGNLEEQLLGPSALPDDGYVEPITSVISLETGLPPPLPSSRHVEAEKLVSSLEAGESLTSADRVRLVLALGRLLLEQGVLAREDLVAELER